MMKKIFLTFAFVLSLFVCAAQAADMPKAKVIKCGHTARGVPVECSLDTNICMVCSKSLWQQVGESIEGTNRALNPFLSAGAAVWSFFTGKESFNAAKHNVLYNESETTTYTCQAKNAAIPKGCSISTIGGISGQTRKSALFGLITLKTVNGNECNFDNIKTVYLADCFSCQIIETLASAFIKAAAKAYDVSRQAANAILLVGMLLWIGFFVLKNISSFSTVEPMKMLQDLFIQFFKALVAYVVINAGIPTILHYTLEPIMLAATNFADTIVVATVNIDTNETKKVADMLTNEEAEKDLQGGGAVEGENK